MRRALLSVARHASDAMRAGDAMRSERAPGAPSSAPPAWCLSARPSPPTDRHQPLLGPPPPSPRAPPRSCRIASRPAQGAGHTTCAERELRRAVCARPVARPRARVRACASLVRPRRRQLKNARGGARRGCAQSAGRACGAMGAETTAHRNGAWRDVRWLRGTFFLSSETGIAAAAMLAKANKRCLCSAPTRPDGESELPLELLECLGSRKEALPRGRLAAAAADHVFAVGGLVAAALCGAQHPAAAAWTPWIPCRCPASREGGWLSDSLAISRLLLSSISRAGPCPMPLADRQRQSGGKLAVLDLNIDEILPYPSNCPSHSWICFSQASSFEP